MRIEKSVTSLSWIPSEAVKGPLKLGFEAGFTHYDQVPPEHLGSLHALQATDRFRFLNHLSAWIEVEEGRIVDAGYGEENGGMMGSTTVKVGPAKTVFQGVGLEDITRDADWGVESATFAQTTGGRTGLPAPR